MFIVTFIIFNTLNRIGNILKTIPDDVIVNSKLKYSLPQFDYSLCNCGYREDCTFYSHVIKQRH